MADNPLPPPSSRPIDAKLYSFPSAVECRYPYSLCYCACRTHRFSVRVPHLYNTRSICKDKLLVREIPSHRCERGVIVALESHERATLEKNGGR